MKFEPVEPQRRIIEHLQKVKDALLYVGVGIGKSASVLAHLNDLFLNAEAISALVIAPLRVINLTWPSEVRDWDQFNWFRVANLRTQSGQRDFLNGTAHLYLVNYESIPLLVSLVERRGGTIPYDVVIYDELTKAKNPSSKRINLYRRKVPRAPRSIGLTGTPVPNSHLDLFAQVRLVDNGERLGNNFLAFQREHFFTNGRPFAKWQEKNGAAKQIEDKISDITLTLRSSDWLSIPDTVVEDVEVHFTPELREKYETLEKELVLELKHGQTMNVANAAALVTKLLQFTSGVVYDEDKKVHTVHDLKLVALARIAKHEKRPLLVACAYQHEMDRIRKEFPKAKFFADAKNQKAQEDMLRSWNASEIEMLVVHPASVGHGLNMQHGSSIIVWMTLTYSRENYEQLIARLARRGQKEITKVYRLIISGTVDDAVASALESKAENEARLISALQMLEQMRLVNGR